MAQHRFDRSKPHERIAFLALVMLYLYKGCTYKQIARELGTYRCNAATVVYWVREARTILREKNLSRTRLIEQMELQLPSVKNLIPFK